MKTLNSQINSGAQYMSVQLSPLTEENPGIEILHRLLDAESLYPVKSYVHRTGKGTEAHTVSDLEREIKMIGRRGLSRLPRYAYMSDGMKMTGWEFIATFNDDKVLFAGRTDENYISVMLPASMTDAIRHILDSILSDPSHKFTEAS